MGWVWLVFKAQGQSFEDQDTEPSQLVNMQGAQFQWLEQQRQEPMQTEIPQQENLPLDAQGKQKQWGTLYLLHSSAQERAGNEHFRYKYENAMDVGLGTMAWYLQTVVQRCVFLSHGLTNVFLDSY